MADAVVTRAILDIDQGLPLALWLSLLCQGGVCSLVVVVEAAPPPNLFLGCISDLRCEGGRSGALPLGGKPLSIPPLELVTYGCPLLCHLSTVVQALRLHTSHCFQPHLNHGHASSWPCVSQMLISPGHQHRSAEVSAQVAVIMDLALCGHYGGSSDSGLAQPPCLSAHKVYSC